ncbi:MAG TPA: response regulator [Acetobacteraceae bacterium]|jgi:CheY-like chemotaxis protein|nr:response regulator [Acetobacteraceae bacterium]
MSNERILLVEDEFLVRLTLVEALSDDGFEVLEASSGDEAATVLERDPSIGLLMTDIQMPGSLDGRALARRARELRPDLPVIFMTGRPDTMGSPAADRRDLFIAKPYLPSEICAAARKLLAKPG